MISFSKRDNTMNPLAKLFAKTPSAMDIRLQLKQLERDQWKKRRELEHIEQTKQAKVEAAVAAKKAGSQELVQDIFREMRQIEIDHGYVNSDLRRLSLSKIALTAFLRKLEMLERDEDHNSVQNLIRRYRDSSIQKAIDQAEVDEDTFGVMLQEILGETEPAVSQEKVREDAGFAEFDRAIEEMAAAKEADDREQPAPGATPDGKVKIRSSNAIHTLDEREELEKKIQELKRERNEPGKKLADKNNKLAEARARAQSLRERAEITRVCCGDEDKEIAKEKALELERQADQADQEGEEVEKGIEIDTKASEEATTDPYVNERDRTKIPEKYQWNLADIYPSREAWKSAKEKLVSEFPEIAKFRGKLAESAQSLRRCLETLSRLGKEQTRLTCYASMTADLDTRDSAALAMKQEMGQVGTDFAALASYVKPEILAIGRHTIEAFLAEDSSLETFRHKLDNILRREEHTGTEGEETIIADAGLMSDAPGSIYSVFTNADFPFPEVTLSTGLKVRLDATAYRLHSRSPVREDRKKVLIAHLGKMHEFRRTFGAQLYAEVRKNMFFSRARRYGSALERALDANNIPISVYTNLVDGVRQNLGTLHRYLGIRKKLLGLEELHGYDLSAPLVKQINRDYRFEEASALVLSSLEPLGQDYIAVVREALQNRWIDVYHNEGKRSGAYSNGAVYDVHPYVLLNYNGKYDGVRTLAHELPSVPIMMRHLPPGKLI